MEIKLEHTAPSATEFNELRRSVGWQLPDITSVNKALNNSLFHVTARVNGQLVGMGRVVGDGALFFYIQDLVIVPSHQGLGIGGLLMQEIETYLQTQVTPGATVGLFSAAGKEQFYAQYGYQNRTGSPLGLGMCRFI